MPPPSSLVSSRRKRALWTLMSAWQPAPPLAFYLAVSLSPPEDIFITEIMAFQLRFLPLLSPSKRRLTKRSRRFSVANVFSVIFCINEIVVVKLYDVPRWRCLKRTFFKVNPLPTVSSRVKFIKRLSLTLVAACLGQHSPLLTSRRHLDR